jgi:DNA (cytosine-5)-methyltransferase 1
MTEIAAVPRNGYTVASLFSGCGGSCLGFRMAGFRVVYACEFVAAARDTYRANFPETPLDASDVRTVTAKTLIAAAETALDSIGDRGVDVLEGSPPCASFSSAGKRARDWGSVKPYSDTEQRTDDLFFEYARIVGELRPKVFVAENVSGLVKGVAKGYFLDILAAFQAHGYRVRSQVLDAKWLGVPQSRERLIFIGVREDLARDPAFPRPFRYSYSVADAVPHLRAVEGANGFNHHRYSSAYRAAATLQATRALQVEAELGERRRFTMRELKAVAGFPDDFELTGTYAQQWERVARAVPPLMMREVAAVIRDRILNA